jgi:hypothetical protein
MHWQLEQRARRPKNWAQLQRLARHPMDWEAVAAHIRLERMAQAQKVSAPETVRAQEQLLPPPTFARA